MRQGGPVFLRHPVCKPFFTVIQCCFTRGKSLSLNLKSLTETLFTVHCCCCLFSQCIHTICPAPLQTPSMWSTPPVQQTTCQTSVQQTTCQTSTALTMNSRQYFTDCFSSHLSALFLPHCYTVSQKTSTYYVLNNSVKNRSIFVSLVHNILMKFYTWKL